MDRSCCHCGNFIAFGSDLENIDLAQKLVQKKQEWEIENLNIFVKVRKSSNESKELTKYGCHYIGNEKDIVFNINNIINFRPSSLILYSIP